MNVTIIDQTSNPLDTIFLAARQCYYPGWVGDIDINSIPQETKELFVKQVVSSGHTSVIEHVSFTFAIDDISRALSHQLVRHRIASYSQQSQRYVQLKEEEGERFGDYVIPSKVQRHPEALEIFESFMDVAFKTYVALTGVGIPAEDARAVLPNSTTTRIVSTFNCRSLLNFFGERCCKCAQEEIREMARAMLVLVQKELPAVFEGKGAKCMSLGYCPETPKRSCGLYPLKSEVLSCYEQKRSKKS